MKPYNLYGISAAFYVIFNIFVLPQINMDYNQKWLVSEITLNSEFFWMLSLIFALIIRPIFAKLDRENQGGGTVVGIAATVIIRPPCKY